MNEPVRATQDGPGTRTAPLSFAQERLWFVQATAPQSPAYNVPLFVRWTEAIDPTALARALDAVVARHDVLRTTYPLHGGEPCQVVHPAAAVHVERIDLAGRPDAADEARRDAACRARLPFDLTTEPPLRCTVWRNVPGGDAMLLCVHHIAIDGWSLASLFGDLAAAYDRASAGEPADLPALPLQYADFAAWERAQLDDAGMRRRIDERVDELLRIPAGLRLGERRRPQAGGGEPARAGEQHVFDVSARTLARVDELAARLRVTRFVVLLAAFQAVLARWSGREDFLVATVTANRPRSDLEHTIGFFVNTVPLRCHVEPGWSFTDLCRAFRGEAFASLRFQELPFDRLVAAAAASRGGGSGLADVAFALQNMPSASLPDRPRWRPPVLLPTGTAKFDLVLLFEEADAGLVATIEYDTACYPPEVVARLAENVRILTEAAVADPDVPLAALPISARGAGEVPPCALVGPVRDLVGEHLRRIAIGPQGGAR